MTKTHKKALDLFHLIAEQCRNADGRTLCLDSADEHAAIIAADDLITNLRQGGEKGGGAITPAKSAASANNGKLGGRPRKKRES